MRITNSLSLLQMLWHKQPFRPQPHSTDLHLVYQNFLFAHCVHVKGYICLLDKSDLCSECYSRIRTSIIRQQYRPLNRHFFINSHVMRDYFCSACSVPVIKARSIDECTACVIKATKLIHALESTSTHVDNIKYPLILNVDN